MPSVFPKMLTTVAVSLPKMPGMIGPVGTSKPRTALSATWAASAASAREPLEVRRSSRSVSNPIITHLVWRWGKSSGYESIVRSSDRVISAHRPRGCASDHPLRLVQRSRADGDVLGHRERGRHQRVECVGDLVDGEAGRGSPAVGDLLGAERDVHETAADAGE